MQRKAQVPSSNSARRRTLGFNVTKRLQKLNAPSPYTLLVLCTLWSHLYTTFHIQNHIAERHWVEINSRVNYPLKTALVWMQNNAFIDMDDPVTKYCVSVMTGILCKVGIGLHMRSWNHHRIPGEFY